MLFSPLSWPRKHRVILALAGLCGLVGIILEYGTYPTPRLRYAAEVLSWTALGLFLISEVMAVRAAPGLSRYLRRRWPTFVLAVLLAAKAALLVAGSGSTWAARLIDLMRVDSVTRAYLVIVQILMVVVFAVELPHLHRRFASLKVRPAAAFVLAFGGLILAGAGLLMLPRATPPGQPIGPVDALFTSTSAVCITGLVVRDTATGFTTFGQAIILCLIQLGGLGIMSLTAALSLLVGRGIGVRESRLLREVFPVPVMGAAGGIIRQIILMTIVFEAVGALLIRQGLEGAAGTEGSLWFTAVFHSVSAFCNAGFGTFSDSLAGPAAGKPLVLGTITMLLVVGGLGFGVVTQLAAWLRGRALGKVGPDNRLGLHSRVVLILSAGLLAGGGILLGLLEWRGALDGRDWGDRVLHAVFQSATCRTAGFNSLDLTTLSEASLLLMIVLMFIGGAPGSTAGGVKVTTIAIGWANLRALMKGSVRGRLGGRELDPVHVQRAMLVLSAGFACVASGLFILLVTEGRSLQVTAFEVVSALGTVGLSLGLTPELSLPGRFVIMALMFIGRLGPLTLAGSLTGAEKESRVRLPRGRILIG
ncbi:MAG: TrkH family potassium uptake protein [Candidatus Krumholzibacteriia bacterium]